MELAISYQIVTPESAEAGEAAESGMCIPRRPACVREVMMWLERCDEASSTVIDVYTWATTSPELDFYTGGECTFSVHVYGITAAQKARLFRMAGIIR
jgi:hypothetical protein